MASLGASGGFEPDHRHNEVPAGQGRSRGHCGHGGQAHQAGFVPNGVRPRRNVAFNEYRPGPVAPAFFRIPDETSPHRRLLGQRSRTRGSESLKGEGRRSPRAFARPRLPPAKRPRRRIEPSRVISEAGPWVRNRGPVFSNTINVTWRRGWDFELTVRFPVLRP